MQADKISVRWGSHVSGSGDLNKVIEKAHQNGFKCLQIFFGAPDAYVRNKLTDTDKVASMKLLKEHDISLNTHFPYWMNLCKQDCRLDVLQAEMNRVGELGGRVVVHTGSCTDCSVANRDLKKASAVKQAEWCGAWQEGADILIGHLNSLEYPADYTLLLEPPAGEGKKLGWRLDQIKYIFDRCPKQVGFCLDTCHAFAAGCCEFDTMESVELFFNALGETLGRGDVKYGLSRMKLIHLNDSQDQFGSMKDRHASLTQGHIWDTDAKFEGLGMIWKLAGQNGIDIVSEVGDEIDIKIMRGIQATFDSL